MTNVQHMFEWGRNSATMPLSVEAAGRVLESFGDFSTQERDHYWMGYNSGPRENGVLVSIPADLKGTNMQETKIKFPETLYEAEHQQILFGTLFGEHVEFRKVREQRPKLIYRSDTSTSLYLLYTVGDALWAVLVNPSKERPVNAMEAWIVPNAETGWFASVQTFFSDVQYHVNHGKPPADRQTW